MNKSVSMLMVALLLLSGCGKKGRKGDEDKKMAMSSVVDYENEDMAFAQGDAAYDAEYDEEFDFEGMDDTEFADADFYDDADYDFEDDEEAEFVFNSLQCKFNSAGLVDGQDEAFEENLELARLALEEGFELVLEGHGDQTGSAGYNESLSLQRAQAVKDVLVAQGLPAEKIRTVGLGNEVPLVWTDAEERDVVIAELAPNRRVEFVITETADA